MAKKDKSCAPIQVFPEFFTFLEDGATDDEIKDALFALYSYSKGDFGFQAKTRYFRRYLPTIVKRMEAAHEKYIEKQKRGQAAAEKRWRNVDESEEEANEEEANDEENKTTLSEIILICHAAYNTASKETPNENIRKRFVWGVLSYGMEFIFCCRYHKEKNASFDDSVSLSFDEYTPRAPKDLVKSIYDIVSKQTQFVTEYAARFEACDNNKYSIEDIFKIDKIPNI